jgi:hypothetical protein
MWNPLVGLYMRPGESITLAWLRGAAQRREWRYMRNGRHFSPRHARSPRPKAGHSIN